MASPTPRPRLHRDRGGLTLVELLVTIALLSIFLGVITSVGFGIQRTTFQSRILAEQQADMRFVADRLGRLIKLGYDIEEAGGVFRVKYPKGVYPGAQYDATDDYYYEEFGLFEETGATDNKKVWIREKNFSLCGHIDSLTVTKNGKDVTIKLVSISSMPGVQRGLPITLETTVTFRNRATP